MFNKITIIGTGLIGGSIGLAVKKKRLGKEVWGVARHRATLKNARRCGAVDRATLDVQKAVRGADLVILATPVGLINPIIKRISPDLKPGAIITDVGSTKKKIVRDAESALKNNAHFVGAHPMAGSEKRGIKSAKEGLFVDSITFLTRTGRTNINSLRKVTRFWRQLGARVVILTPAEHDRIMARVSHLPHVVSSALVRCINRGDFSFIGDGFRDMSRIASGDPVLWRDISLTNINEIISAIDKLTKGLAYFTKILRRQDQRAIQCFFTVGKLKRDKFIK